MNLIRKISVGLNYPDNVLHYQVDKPVRMGQEIKNVKRIVEGVRSDGAIQYEIYVDGDNNASVLWKTIIGVPVVIEDMINFD